jgi:hypothetical protein
MRRTGSIRAAFTKVEMSEPEYISVSYARTSISGSVMLEGVVPIS